MNLRYILAFVIAITFTAVVIINLFPTISNVAVSGENISFVANDTYYNLGNTPIYTSEPYTPSLAYSNGTALSNYTFTTTQVKIGFNIAPANYYASYEYYKQAWLGGNNYSWAVALIIFIGMFAVMLKFLGLV